jgi:hypothetical protein
MGNASQSDSSIPPDQRVASSSLDAGIRRLTEQRLIPAAEMPMIRGMDVPRSFYWVLRDPAPLAGMAYPGAKTPWTTLHDLGFRHVVCLAAKSPGYDPAPLRHVYAEDLQDLVGGQFPRDPAREERLSGAAARNSHRAGSRRRGSSRALSGWHWPNRDRPGLRAEVARLRGRRDRCPPTNPQRGARQASGVA